jgi:hypothetical protein
MPAVLLIRDRSDLPSAVEAANALLQIRRRHGVPDGDDEVLAICFRKELDAGLPSWPATGEECEEAEMGIRESVSLCGVWALCWLDGPRLRRTADSSCASAEVMRALLKDELPGPSAFVPVSHEYVTDGVGFAGPESLYCFITMRFIPS